MVCGNFLPFTPQTSVFAVLFCILAIWPSFTVIKMEFWEVRENIRLTSTYAVGCSQVELSYLKVWLLLCLLFNTEKFEFCGLSHCAISFPWAIGTILTLLATLETSILLSLSVKTYIDRSLFWRYEKFLPVDDDHEPLKCKPHPFATTRTFECATCENRVCNRLGGSATEASC